MGLNFRKRIKLGKFINMNLGKTGAGFSFGIPGARISVNSKGQSRASLGIPGTGLSYTKSLGTLSKKAAAKTKLNNVDSSESQEDALAAYNEALLALSHIHTEAYDFIDFSQLPIEYTTREIGPLQKEAIAALESYKPSFLDKLLRKDDDKLEELQEAVFKAIEEDQENKKIHTVDSHLAKELQALDASAMDQFIDKIGGFDIFDDDCVSISHSYQMNVDQASAIIVNITTNLAEDVLNTEATLTKAGNLSNKKLSKSAFNERTYAYVCSLALGVATEALAITPLDKCFINITDSSTNPATGLKETKTILAGEFNESELIQYDYETLNPIDVVEKSLVETSFTKRNGFKEVKPIEA